MSENPGKMPEHLEKVDFDKLTDEIKAAKIGQKFMNHALECPECMEMSRKLNEQIARHCEELEKLT
jgi:hypothetical protein